MICKNCNKFFNKERRFHELLTRPSIYLCKDCLNQHEIDLSEEILPLDKGYILRIIYLYRVKRINNIDYLVFDYSKILSRLIKRVNYLIIEDKFNLNNLDNYNYLALLLESDITLISFVKTL